MRYLVIFMFLLGCGADPDDYQPQPSDGCRSDDTECQAKVAAEKEEGKKEETEASTEDKEEAAADDKEKDSVTINNTNNITVVIGPNGDEVSEDDADNCMAGRICRGLRKAEVLDLLPEPNSIEKEDQFEVWEWINEWDGLVEVCSSYSCTLTFRDGILVDQERIKASWLDLDNF